MLVRLLLATLTALAFTAAPAAASTVSLVDGNLSYRADTGESNQFTLGYSDANPDQGRPDAAYVIAGSSSETVNPGSGCERRGDDTTMVHCAAGDGASKLTVELGDGDDSFDAPRVTHPALTALALTVDGGTGNDTLLTHTDSGMLAQLSGGDGDDTLWGAALSDTLAGGGGNDRLFGGGGADVLDGGDGIDTVLYQQPWQPFTGSLNISLDDLAGDGAAGENDTLLAVERVAGGDGVDTLTGNAGDNELVGGGGNDVVNGGGGNDLLVGEGSSIGGGPSGFQFGAGDDVINGGDGNDTIEGGDGDDTLGGDVGDDTLNGGVGADAMTGGDGDDTFLVNPTAAPSELARVSQAGGDAADTVNAGPGNDRVFGGGPLTSVNCGSGDDVQYPDMPVVAASGCEAVCVSSDWCAPDVPRQGVVTVTDGVASVPVTCPEQTDGGCTGTLNVSAQGAAASASVAATAAAAGKKKSKKAKRTVKLGQRKYKVKAGKRAVVRVKLTRKALRSMRKLRRAKAAVTLNTKGAGKRWKVPARTVKLKQKAAKRKHNAKRKHKAKR